ncbi:MAG: NADH-quinone oxidoreductase subunit H [Candidatus Moranbacteria bacterium]|nr:NADH-quinone oxidoreductase subunit H [Candidatus Moranbacteria bacterium]MDD3965226.1 NADH-quinone oxidoreductase subunit H [Candidatus Moranbacteria bacterium]
MTFFLFLLQGLFVPVVSPLCVGVIKKIKARLQNRQGASIVQPYRDLWKLFHKDERVSRDASWIFFVAPFIVFTVTIFVGWNIPLFSLVSGLSLTSDALVIVYALALGTFFLALSGMDIGGAFGGFGSSREMTLSALAEGGFIFSLLTLALMAGTTDLFDIASHPLFHNGQYFIPVVLAFSGFFIVLLAETARFPFDNPATHLELTMIHEAMILEYSGKRLALMEWASANKLVVFFALGANIFFPIGLSSSVSMSALLIGIGALLLKLFVFCIVIALIESSMAKFRFFRLPDLLVASFILNAVAIGLVHSL